MDLTALSEEYRTAADRLQERLRELRVFAQTARGEEAFAAQRRIDASTPNCTTCAWSWITCATIMTEGGGAHV